MRLEAINDFMAKIENLVMFRVWFNHRRDVIFKITILSQGTPLNFTNLKYLIFVKYISDID